MKKLLKAYGFNSDMQYFERIISLRNDTNRDYRNAGVQMFKDMPVKNRKLFCVSALTSWNSGLTMEQISTFVNFI